ncbi:uncharacterized protein MYCFIDRAFT_208266 [Pseudocercospora fijiensis CIRAD86]|uniref:Uncharacterized protein n=1 Tax=Pseudocercospora fijiensis (strain CIRAD86) TaxID=383855 RepID=M2ZPZ7_PSEFD|nr:uncharacterized protein MYCFIDRAFT_208266 [Pseudocercospora fijiensis CIRAD86]EME81149.1 hypothetical protein MYCFIDRAFT_208266 [Pseudocercospora fijiensis CIRAD86]
MSTAYSTEAVESEVDDTGYEQESEESSDDSGWEDLELTAISWHPFPSSQPVMINRVETNWTNSLLQYTTMSTWLRPRHECFYRFTRANPSI